MSRIFLSDVNNILQVNRHRILSLQILRWRRKPRWEPIAKSKLVIPERKKQLQNEKKELISLHNKYRTQINSIRSYMHDELKNPIATCSYKNSFGVAREQQYLDHKCIEKNIMWNNNISLQREKRIAEQSKDKIKFVNERLELAKLREEFNRNNENKEVDMRKISAKYFISEAELHDEIVKALENCEEDLFSIDLKGGVYKNQISKTS